MALEFKKAKREQVRMKISVSGPSGSGKTLSSLRLAFGITKAQFPNLSDEEIWSKICVIDTENGSGSLYVGFNRNGCQIGDYNVITLTPPYEPQLFVDAIHMAEENGTNVIIIDSLSHAWAGQGGALDQQGAIAARSGNSWTAWRQVTPQHNKLVDAMLQSPCHVIASMRAKMEYEQITNDAGKKQVKAIGMGVIMRDGIEYEFTVAFMLDYEHVANATKDRTGLFDKKYFVIDENVGKQMYQWLSSGAPVEEPKPNVPAPAPAPAAGSDEQLQKAIDSVDKLIQPLVEGADKEKKAEVAARIKAVIGTANYKKCTDIDKLRELYREFKE